MFNRSSSPRVPGMMPQTRAFGRSGGGGFVPTDIAGCVMWLPAYGITGLSDGDPVSSWSDQSGSGNDAIQATGAFQPSYQTNELNGLPVIRFDDAASNRLVSIFLLTTRTVFILTKRIPPQPGDGTLDDAITTAGALFLRQSSGTTIGFFTGAFVGGSVSSGVADAWIIMALTVDYITGSTEVLINGTSLATGSTSPATSGLTIGSRAGGSSAYNGDYAEVIAYDSVLSPSDLASVHGYLNSTYAL